VNIVFNYIESVLVQSFVCQMRQRNYVESVVSTYDIIMGVICYCRIENQHSGHCAYRHLATTLEAYTHWVRRRRT